MKRYKELKFEGEVFTEQYKIDDILIENGFDWFLNCEVENVRIEIQYETLIFNAGVFFNGNWMYGVFRNGEWKNGIFHNGVWYNGTFRTGKFKSGLIFNGRFFNGTIEKETVIKGGNFYDIKIHKEVEREDKYEIERDDDIELNEPEILEGVGHAMMSNMIKRALRDRKKWDEKQKKKKEKRSGTGLFSGRPDSMKRKKKDNDDIDGSVPSYISPDKKKRKLKDLSIEEIEEYLNNRKEDLFNEEEWDNDNIDVQDDDLSESLLSRAGKKIKDFFFDDYISKDWEEAAKNLFDDDIYKRDDNVYKRNNNVYKRNDNVYKRNNRISKSNDDIEYVETDDDKKDNKIKTLKDLSIEELEQYIKNRKEDIFDEESWPLDNVKIDDDNRIDEEISYDLVNSASKKMKSLGQNNRAKDLETNYYKTKYDFSQFKDLSIFDGYFINSIELKDYQTRKGIFKVVEVSLSTRTEYNRGYMNILYFIDEDQWRYLPHENNIGRKDVRILGKISKMVNPDTKYKTGIGDIKIGKY